MISGAIGCGEAGGSASPQEQGSAIRVRPGIEVLLSDSLHLVAGRRVGLVTNHTGLDGQGRSDIDLLYEHPQIELVAVYGPEHGVRGTALEGITVADDVDPATGVPFYSLYGSADARKPGPDALEGVEILLFDLQDVGARYYTYVSTMALAMEAAGEHDIPFIVLDRPNPIRGDAVQGNLLEPALSSFVGMFPVPMRHGMTAGELARMYVGEFGIDVDLIVVPAEGWTRDVPYDETGLPWVAPSPNMPSLESALAYPGTCLFEGTNLSVGRGTERAFQWVGAPWLDAQQVVSALEEYGIPGVRFEPATFVPAAPSDGKYDGESVQAIRIRATADTFDAPLVAVAMLVEIHRAHPDEWAWLGTFDRLAGTEALRRGIDRDLGVDALTADWPDATREFERRRAPYLIYD